MPQPVALELTSWFLLAGFSLYLPREVSFRMPPTGYPFLSIDKSTPSHPVIVRKVTHIVDTGFGASATADVGDGTTADLWIANTAVTENTAGDVASSTIGGKKYTSAFQVKVTLGGTRTGGAGTLMVEMVRL